MASLQLPDANLLTVLLGDNGVSDEQPIWIDGAIPSPEITKSRARDLVRRLADGYITAGLVSPGSAKASVVMLYSENQPIHYPNILAVLAAGGIVATCPWVASVDELLYRIGVLRPTAILCSKSSVSRAVEAQQQAEHPFSIVVQDSQSMTVTTYKENQSLLSNRHHDWDETWNEDVANRTSAIVFSSGTTGYPKGVTLSQRNILAMVCQMQSRWANILYAKDRWPRFVGALDSSHVAGLTVNCFLTLKVGFTNYLVPGTDIDLMLSTLESERINFLVAVPPMLQRLLAHPRWAEADIGALQRVWTGASKCPSEVQQAVTNKMVNGGFCQQAWGMTELTCLATLPEDVLGPWESVGTALDGNKIKVCAEDGTEVPIGHDGEIYVSGPTKTNGYYGQTEEQRRATFVDEWIRTGDIGHVDPKGYLFITGRNKDLIKYNGTQVWPHEIEDVVKTHELVADAAVVGMELEDGNELPAAFVVLRDAARGRSGLEADIRAYAAKHVSPYKRLRGGVHVVAAIPKNPMGKVQYQDLRAAAKELRQTALSSKL